MKKFKFILVLSIIALMAFCGVACKGPSKPSKPTPQPPETITITGFDIDENYNVTIENNVLPTFNVKNELLSDIETITDSKGATYTVDDITYVVKDSGGNNVQLDNGAFVVSDFAGYSIKFTLVAQAGTKSETKFEKQTLISVNNVYSNYVVYENGIRNTNTLNLNYKNIDSFTLTQYILRDDGQELTLKDADGQDFTVKAYGVDVSAKYSDSINKATGIVDTTLLDGIFCLEVEGDNGDLTVYFEQGHENQFVWNNVPDVNGAGIAAYWTDGAYSGNGAINLIDDENHQITGGREGVYYSFKSNFADEHRNYKNGFNLKIYPAHTKAYFEQFGNQKVIMDFYFTHDDAPNDTGSQSFRSGLGFGGVQRDSADCPNLWSSGTSSSREDLHFFELTSLLTYWDNLLSTNKKGGGFLGYYEINGSTYKGDFTLYFGNFHIIGDKTYTVEHYFENASTGEYDLLETETLTADENITIEFSELAGTLGYEFNHLHQNNVLTGVNDGKLVLKGYYDISQKTTEDLGMIDNDSLTFNAKLFNNYSLTQYVIKDDGDVNLGNGNMGQAIDVKALYPNIIDFTNGIVNISNLDGIFTLTLIGNGINLNVNFEHVVKGKITWNNIANVNSIGLGGLYTHASYNGNGSLNVANVSGLNNNHKYFDANGTYFVFSSNFQKEDATINGQNGFNIKLYPVHTKEYYQEILAGTDVTFLMRYYLQLSGYDNDTFSFYSNLGYTNGDETLITYDNPNCWGNNVPDYDESARFQTGKINLSDLIENWDNVISSNKGGGFLGYTAQETLSNYKGDFNLYFGELFVVSNVDYKVERYFEYQEREDLFYPGETAVSYMSAPFGEYIEFSPDKYDTFKIAENYKYSVLSGINDGRLVIKAYYKYYVEHPTYNVEVYLENESGDFIRSTEYSYTATSDFKANVVFEPFDIPGYYYDAHHDGTIDTGVNRVSLTLKVFYARDNTWTITETILNGIRKDKTLNLNAQNISELSIKQYVLRNDGSSLTLKDANGEEFTINAYAIDVTEKYKNLVNLETGIMDTSSLSGIFTIEVLGNKSKQIITFEQEQDGVFVWNNISDVLSTQIRDKWAASYKGQGTIEPADMSSAVMSGMNGTYFYYSSPIKDEWGIKIFPVHTLNYYQNYVAIDEDISITYNFYYKGSSYDSNNLNSNLLQFYAAGNNSKAEAKVSNVPAETWNKAKAIKLQAVLERWSSIITHANTGSCTFLTIEDFRPNADVEVYIGNVTIANTLYKVNVYVEQNEGSGDYAFSDELSYFGIDDLNAQVVIEPIKLAGYSYVQNNDEVLAGVNNGNLVLKVYYIIDNSITEKELYSGILTQNTLSIKIDNPENYTLTQYVLRADGEELLLKDDNGMEFTVKAKAVNVTETYPNIMDKDTNTFDISGLDGIFTLVASAGKNKHEITFETKTEQFVWSNLHDLAGTNLTQRSGAKYTGTGYLALATNEEIANTNPGSNPNYNPNGKYFKYVTDNSQSPDGVNLNVYPTHSYDYYQDWANKYPNALLTIPFNFVTNKPGYTGTAWYNYGEGYTMTTRECTWGDTSGWAARKTFTLSSFLKNWEIAQKGNGTSLLGYKIGSWVSDGPLTIYYGAPFIVSLPDEANALYGKKISFLGDSITSFEGYSNNAKVFNSTMGRNNAGYGKPGYGDDLASVNDTWWMQTVNNLGASLLVNNSSGGSRVSLDHSELYNPASYKDIRCLNLHDDTNPNDPLDTNYVIDPDIIVIYLGVNDWNTSWWTIGTFEGVNFDTLITQSGTSYTYKEPQSFAEAYAIMLHKITTRYSDADIFVGNLPSGFASLTDPSKHNEIISKLAEKFGATLIDFNSTEISGTQYRSYTFDGMHPKKQGMTIMANKATETIKAKYENA